MLIVNAGGEHQHRKHVINRGAEQLANQNTHCMSMKLWKPFVALGDFLTGCLGDGFAGGALLGDCLAGADGVLGDVFAGADADVGDTFFAGALLLVVALVCFTAVAVLVAAPVAAAGFALFGEGILDESGTGSSCAFLGDS